MRRIRLTKAIADALEYEGGSQTIYWDTQTPSFALAIYPSGRKSFFASYYAGGRERRMILGRLGEITVDEARSAAAEILAKVRRGEDPMAERDKERAGLTLGEFWTQTFYPDAAKRWKPSTAKAMTWLWEKFIAPALGKVRLTDLSRKHVGAFHRSLADTPYNANHSLGLLKIVWNTAKKWELVEGDSPLAAVKKYPEKSRERFLSGEEIARLWDAISEEEVLGGRAAVEHAAIEGGGDRRKAKEMESRGISAHAAALFRLLLLTGARLSEIMKARWAFVNWDAASLDLPDSKTGAKRISLNRAALEELRRLWDMRSTDAWIIEGRLSGAHLVNPERPWRRVRQRAGLDDLRLHDLRHSAASLLVARGTPLFTVGKVLGHTRSATTEKYSHLRMDSIQAAAEALGEAVMDALKPAGARVLPVPAPIPGESAAKKSEAAR